MASCDFYLYNKLEELFCVVQSLSHDLMMLGCSVTRLGDFLEFGQNFKAFLSKSPTFLGNFCKGAKIYHFPSEIIFGQLL